MTHVRFNQLHNVAKQIDNVAVRKDVLDVFKACAQNAFDTIFIERDRDASEFEDCAEGSLVSVLSDFRGWFGDGLREAQVIVWFNSKGFRW